MHLTVFLDSFDYRKSQLSWTMSSTISSTPWRCMCFFLWQSLDQIAWCIWQFSQVKTRSSGQLFDSCTRTQLRFIQRQRSSSWTLTLSTSSTSSRSIYIGFYLLRRQAQMAAGCIKSVVLSYSCKSLDNTKPQWSPSRAMTLAISSIPRRSICMCKLFNGSSGQLFDSCTCVSVINPCN